MNFKTLTCLGLLLSGLLLFGCSTPSFEDQIKNDIMSKMATGICDSIPKGAVISNIKVGEIVDIGLDGMTDVSIEFDFEKDGITKHHSSAMLYLKKGNTYKLGALGACDWEMKQ
jgi:hypothetical protein